MRHLILLCIFAILHTKIRVHGDEMLGPGIWSLISIGDCPDQLSRQVFEVALNKHKLNRTHDGISFTLKMCADIDNSYGALIEICKHVDGGCKQYQVVTDESMVNLLNKYSETNVRDVLALAGMDPPEFPIAEGEYEVEDYIMDYCELPREAPYGKFEALAYLVRDQEKLACVKCVLEFNKFEDENFCDE